MYSEVVIRNEFPNGKTTMPSSEVAKWDVKHPIAVSIGITVACTFLTAVGVATGQILKLEKLQSIYVMTASVAISAIIGLVWMRLSRRSLAAYGLRTPENGDIVWWGLPLLLSPLLTAFSGIQVSGGVVIAYLVFTACVALNEEIWFRGLILAALGKMGTKRAVTISAGLFSILHLSNALNGKSAGYLIAQLVFALLVGIVLAELFFLTGSLWIGIGWHFLHNSVAMTTGDGATWTSWIINAVFAVLAVYWWRKLEN